MAFPYEVPSRPPPSADEQAPFLRRRRPPPDTRPAICDCKKLQSHTHLLGVITPSRCKSLPHCQSQRINMNHGIRVTFLTYILASVSFIAAANELILDPGNGGLENSSVLGTKTYGFDFTVRSQPLLITALGIFDDGSDGLIASHPVGLWNSSGSLLASVVIPAGTLAPNIDGFRYVTLSSPVTLAAGTLYVLGAGYGFLDDNYRHNLNGNQATFDSAVTPGRAKVSSSAAFTFPDANEGAGSEVGPSVIFSVPEPNTMGLFGCAVIMLCCKRLTMRCIPQGIRRTCVSLRCHREIVTTRVLEIAQDSVTSPSGLY